ncbi:class I adenylate-forming enzyme family protein [Verrucomicrobiota bacterium sgz303538]
MRTPSSENAILTAWRQILASQSGTPAVYATDGSVQRTFSDIEAEALEIERLFERFEVQSVIGLQIGNSERWPAVLLALFRRGLIPLPLGRHVETAELDAALNTCGAAALVTIEHGELSIKECTHNRSITWTGTVPEFLKLTSGTTSAPRAVRFQAHQLMADCDNICATMGITERDVNFGVIPFSHSYGFSNLVTPLLCRGVRLVASEDRLPRAIVNDLARSGATVFPGMPVFFDKLASLEHTPELPHLRLCISAGAPLTHAVGTAFTGRFGLKIHTFYGSSECGGIGYDATDEPEYRDGFVGRAMDGVSIEPNADEEAGRITVSGPAVGDGYYPLSDEDVLGNGRFVPSDLVRFTESGMFIVGRASDVINIAGRKLNPAEVEARIAAFPGVKQAVVFGVPSPLRGEEPVACVAGESVNPAELLRFCRTELSEWQQPRDIWIVEEIPTNERGKVSRRLLAERYCTARG